MLKSLEEDSCQSLVNVGVKLLPVPVSHDSVLPEQWLYQAWRESIEALTINRMSLSLPLPRPQGRSYGL